MERNQEHLKPSESHRKNEVINTSFDTEDESVEMLMKNGFTSEQATSWLRKKYIDRLFEKGR